MKGYPEEEASEKIINQSVVVIDQSDDENPNQDDPNEIQGFKLSLTIEVQPQKNTQSAWDIKEKHVKRETDQATTTP